jgi:hypothetical protein
MLSMRLAWRSKTMTSGWALSWVPQEPTTRWEPSSEMAAERKAAAETGEDGRQACMMSSSQGDVVMATGAGVGERGTRRWPGAAVGSRCCVLPSDQ